LKDLDAQEDDCGYMWGQFGEAWYFVIMRMTRAIYTKDKIWKMFEKDRCSKDFWEILRESDIVNTFYVLKNDLAVWEQVWKFHADNTGTCQEDKVKFNMYKHMTEMEFEEEGLNNDNKISSLYQKDSTKVGLRKSQ
jgi:hypothetical protein